MLESRIRKGSSIGKPIGFFEQYLCSTVLHAADTLSDYEGLQSVFRSHEEKLKKNIFQCFLTGDPHLFCGSNKVFAP